MAESTNICMSCGKSFSNSRGLGNHLPMSPSCQDAYSRNSLFTYQSSVIRAHNRSTSSSSTNVENERHQFEEGGVVNQGSSAGAGADLEEGISMLQGDDEDVTVMDDGDDGDSENSPSSSFLSPAHTNEDFIDALLLSLCEKISAPQYAFDLILEWASYASIVNYDFLSRTRPRRKRKSVVTMLRKRYNMENLRPRT
jgi:hypothetical protein